MNFTEIETTLYYLQRVTPRGKMEENELYALIQRLKEIYETRKTHTAY